MAPSSRVEVALRASRVCAGAAPATSTPTTATRRSRPPSPTGPGAGPTCADGAAILYDVDRRDGAGQNLSLRFAADGTPPRTSTRRRRAALPRDALLADAAQTRSDDGRAEVRAHLRGHAVLRPLAVCASTLCGEAVRPVHESLSLDRFRNPLVRLMLPFRMPRRTR